MKKQGKTLSLLAVNFGRYSKCQNVPVTISQCHTVRALSLLISRNTLYFLWKNMTRVSCDKMLQQNCQIKRAKQSHTYKIIYYKGRKLYDKVYNTIKNLLLLIN